jgi:hypothetical protein
MSSSQAQRGVSRLKLGNPVSSFFGNDSIFFFIFLFNSFLGIGAACALALAEAGASICLIQRNPTDGNPPNLETLNSIKAKGVSAEVVYCDLDDLQAVKDVFQKALDVMNGQIHVLVNCGGIQRRSPAVDFPEGDWDDVCMSFNSFLVQKNLSLSRH